MKAYCLKLKDELLIYYTADTKWEIIELVENHIGITWKRAGDYGYSIVRIEIREIEE